VEVKRPGLEADHSPPSSAEVNECVELYLRSPDTPLWHGTQLKEKHRDNFTFTCHKFFLGLLIFMSFVFLFCRFGIRDLVAQIEACNQRRHVVRLTAMGHSHFGVKGSNPTWP
jgi:hypothetical protein